jgi:prolipoprotein diacylglyceryltransferase
MTVERFMLITSILMVLGSVVWMVWDLRRKSRERQKNYTAWLEKVHRTINDDKEGTS